MATETTRTDAKNQTPADSNSQIVRTSDEKGVGSTIRYTVEGRETIEGVVLDAETTERSILDVESGRIYDGVRYFVKPKRGKAFWTSKFRVE